MTESRMVMVKVEGGDGDSGGREGGALLATEGQT
jgi:hypothetical protein